MNLDLIMRKHGPREAWISERKKHGIHRQGGDDRARFKETKTGGG
jgi:hypothetical protein